MLTWSAPLVLAAAMLCWPHRPGRARAAALAARPRSRDWLPSGVRKPSTAVITMAAATVGLLVAGPAGAVASAVGAVTTLFRWRARRRQARSLAAAADVAEALGLLAAELRAGAHPATAAERTADGAGPAAAAVLGTIAATARLSGDVPAALRREAEADNSLERPFSQLSVAWTLAQRHGIPLADVLDAVRRDLDHRVRAHRRLHAALAGPRATAIVLAALPMLGLLLGQAVGAEPWQVLTRQPGGQLLLILGIALICAGLAWSGRLVAKAARP